MTRLEQAALTLSLVEIEKAEQDERVRQAHETIRRSQDDHHAISVRLDAALAELHDAAVEHATSVKVTA